MFQNANWKKLPVFTVSRNPDPEDHGNVTEESVVENNENNEIEESQIDQNLMPENRIEQNVTVENGIEQNDNLVEQNVLLENRIERNDNPMEQNIIVEDRIEPNLNNENANAPTDEDPDYFDLELIGNDERQLFGPNQRFQSGDTVRV